MVRRRTAPWLAVAALLLVLCAGAAGWVFVWDRAAPPGAPQIESEVRPGESLRDAARRLADAGLVAGPRRFELAARLLGGARPLQAGVYRFARGTGWGALLDAMQRGEVIVLKIAIPEGMPSVMVADRLREQTRLSGPVEVPAEGSVLPDTYLARPGEPRAAVLARMQKAMATTLDRLWKGRSPAAVVKTPREAVILASIVEKETADPEERRRIAGLYSNRLARGMRLEADPTVIYPITRGRPLGRRILRSELMADNGYNSYVRAGLPEGPITNPGRESLAAVLDPERNAYLFMVADGTGRHQFAASFAEHQRNVQRWYAIRRQRGEM
jgi:UPF0755 protein